MKTDSFDRIKHFYDNYKNLDIDEVKQFYEDCNNNVVLNRKRQIYLNEQRIKKELKNRKIKKRIRKTMIIACLPIFLICFFLFKDKQISSVFPENYATNEALTQIQEPDSISSQIAKRESSDDNNGNMLKKSAKNRIKKEAKKIDKPKTEGKSLHCFAQAEIEKIKRKISLEYSSLMKDNLMGGNEDAPQIYPKKTKISDIKELTLFCYSGYSIENNTLLYFLTDKSGDRLSDTLTSDKGILNFTKLKLSEKSNINPFYVEVYDANEEYLMRSEIIKSHKKTSLPDARELKSIDDFLVLSYKLKEDGYFSEAFSVLEHAKKKYGSSNETRKIQRILMK